MNTSLDTYISRHKKNFVKTGSGYWAQSSAKARLGVGNKGGRAIVKDARALISRNKQHTTKDARDTIKSKLVNKAGGDLRSILTQKSRANTQSAVNLRRTAGGRITKKTSGVAQRGIGGAGRPLRVQIQQEVGNLLMEDEETQSFSSVARDSAVKFRGGSIVINKPNAARNAVTSQAGRPTPQLKKEYTCTLIYDDEPMAVTPQQRKQMRMPRAESLQIVNRTPQQTFSTPKLTISSSLTNRQNVTQSLGGSTYMDRYIPPQRPDSQTGQVRANWSSQSATTARTGAYRSPAARQMAARPAQQHSVPTTSQRNRSAAKGTSEESQVVKILVTNLSHEVNQEDVVELFGDVGEMNSATLVRPGLAEVLYKTVAAANKAISLYHNRELDGIPMNIQLISAPERSSTAAQSAKYSFPLDDQSVRSLFHRQAPTSDFFKNSYSEFL